MDRAATIAVLVGLLFVRYTFALNPSFDIDQYTHKAWTIRDGFFKGTITSIAQMPDGYLLLGGESGLIRFDGVRTMSWMPPGYERLPSSFILALLVARDGSVWIGYHGGLAHWSDGKVTQYSELSGYSVRSVLEDQEGTVWAGGFGVPNGKACAIRGGSVQCFGQDGSFGKFVRSLYMADGYLWAATETGLWRLRPGSPQRYPGFRFAVTPQALTRTDDGRFLFVSDRTIHQIVNGKVKAYPVRAVDPLFKPNSLFRDRDGGFWVGSLDHGTAVVHGQKISLFGRPDGLSGDGINFFFEDREGNIWVATDGGLDRFTEASVSTISTKQGLSTALQSVLAAKDGTVWITSRKGLNRWRNGHITLFRKADGLQDDDPGVVFQDDGGRVWASSSHGLAWFDGGRFVGVKDSPGGVMHAIATDNQRNLWLSEEQKLLHVQKSHVIEEFAWPHLGRKRAAQVLLSDPKQGGLWMGFVMGDGLAYFKDGRIWRSYTAANGLGHGVVAGIQLEPDGTVWASTEGGLSRIKNGRILTLTVKNGLPCDRVRWTIADDEHAFWLYTSCGLVRIARTDLVAWVANPDRKIQNALFDATDGVRLNSAYLAWPDPHVVKASDGKVWFVTTEGIQVIDPRHLPVNKLPPPVHIESVKADGKAYDVKQGLRLPAKVRDVWFDYTALSLVAPEKTRFRYKLEAQDPNWKEVVNDREARYSNLAPGTYRFRVIASNNRGVWNRTGDTLEFSIAAAFYQTHWFLAVCVATGLAMVWGLHRLRLYQLAREFHAQVEGRVDERLRVSRELHDTLLQGCQASLIQMQAARDLFSRRPEQAAHNLDDAITMAAGAIAEGRGAIQELRSQPPVQDDLVKVLTVTGQDLARSQEANEHPVSFRLEVEGAPQQLEPLLQDEVSRIARELLRNAFRHSQASQIEAEIRYDPHLLRLHVRDDGKGIHPDILKAGGRGGHWGLAGMRERAKRIGARLDFWSQAGAGTEVRLTVPASIAYQANHKGSQSWLLRRRRASS